MEEGNGLMSSIFSGYKFLPGNQQPDWIEQVVARNGKRNNHALKVANPGTQAQSIGAKGGEG
jgi:Ni/Fe-hydrogenase 1 B-type cytochrome subunit